jgi:hypothetical protein
MLRHGGERFGYRSLVSLMPHDRIGVVVLTNLDRTWLPYILTYHAYEHLLGLGVTPWGERFRRWLARGEASPVPETAGRAAASNPPWPLEEYAGEFEHPGYGPLRVRVEGDHLAGAYNGLEVSLTHREGDTFEFAFRWTARTVTRMGTFSTEGTGCVEGLSIPIEPLVQAVTFARVR